MAHSEAGRRKRLASCVVSPRFAALTLTVTQAAQARARGASAVRRQHQMCVCAAMLAEAIRAGMAELTALLQTTLMVEGAIPPIAHRLVDSVHHRCFARPPLACQLQRRWQAIAVSPVPGMQAARLP